MFEDILNALSGATDDQLRAALGEIHAKAAEYTGAATAESAAAVTKLAEHAAAINGELTTRTELAARQAQALANINSLTELPDAPAETAAAEEPAVEAPAEPAAPEGAQTVEENADENTNEPEGGEGSVTASGKARRPLGGAGVTPKGDKPPASFRLIGKVSSAVRTFSSDPDVAREEIATAFADYARDRTPVGRVNLVSANWQDSYRQAGRFVGRDTTAFNVTRTMEKVEKLARSEHASKRDSLVAAGICGPVDTAYDIPVIGDTDRPVRDALARLGADRGGLQYRPAIDGVSQTGGIGNWTSAQDEADPIVPKVCLEVDCPTPVTVEVDAIYQCLTFSNMSTTFDPEFMDSVVQAQAIAHARFAENKLLTQLTNASKTLYSVKLLGAVRDALATVDKVVAYYKNVHRLNDEAPLRWIVPLWLKDMFRADITRQMVGDGLDALAISDEQIEEWFTRRNINITYHLDGINPADITVPDPDIVVPDQAYTTAAANTEVPGFKDAVSTLLFREGDWKYLDGGELNMGIVRDSVLNSENRFQTFQEEFGTAAFRGIESLHLVLQLQPTGQSAATVSTASVVD